MPAEDLPELLDEPGLWRRTLHEPDEVKRQGYERRLHALWKRIGAISTTRAQKTG